MLERHVKYLYNFQFFVDFINTLQTDIQVRSHKCIDYLFQRHFCLTHGRITFVVHLRKHEDVFSRHKTSLVYPKDGADVTRDATAATTQIRGSFASHRCLQMMKNNYKCIECHM